jgi:hypothetical protein
MPIIAESTPDTNPATTAPATASQDVRAAIMAASVLGAVLAVRTAAGMRTSLDRARADAPTPLCEQGLRISVSWLFPFHGSAEE